MKYFVELNNEFYSFIKNNENSDPSRLLLSSSGKKYPFDIKKAIIQIEARKKVCSKLSSFIANDRFIFPDLLVAEQSTHQLVARYNATLLPINSVVIDMTAGLGIDAFTFANNNHKVLGIEYNNSRCRALIHNTMALGLEEYIKFVNCDSTQLLPRLAANPHFTNRLSETETIIFIDPARRGKNNSRTYFLEDCVPDITKMPDIIFQKTAMILVKASPLLDISRALKQFPGTREIHIVAVKGEVKEILLVIDKLPQKNHIIIYADTINSNKSGGNEITPVFRINHDEMGNKECPIAEGEYIKPGFYLYDPSAGIHKINAGNQLCKRFAGLRRLSNDTDIYTSNTLYKDFPGRIFSVTSLLSATDMKHLKGAQATAISRNHPMSAEDIKKKYKLKESAQNFIFGLRIGNHNKPVFISATKIS